MHNHNKPRLLFYFTQQVAPEAGGVERVMSALSHTLSSLGYRITIVFLTKLKSSSHSCVPNQIQLPSIDGKAKENTEFIIDLIRSEKFDVAMNFGAIFNKSSRAFVDACIQTKTPMISIYHNTLDWPLWANAKISRLMLKKSSRYIIYLLYRIIQKNPFTRNAHFISRHSSASVVLGKSYIDQYHKFIDRNPNKLLAIYNPLTLTIDNYEVTQKENVVLFVGRLEYQKNLECLLRIWSRIRTNDWKLEIVGSGPDEEIIKRYAKELNMSSSIFKGPTSHPEDYYKRAKIFVMTSLYEGFPMTLIECQAYGCVPVIFDSYPAAKEIVNNSNGILIENFDESLFEQKLSALMHDEDKISLLQKSAMNWTKNFELNTITKKWDNLIQNLIHKR